MRMTIAIGITQRSNDLDTSSKPSTALSTEIAGVMMPSPYSNEVPNTPNETRMPALATVPPVATGWQRCSPRSD